MKKFLLILVSILAAINASAWDNYYYCGTNKVHFTMRPHRMLLVTPSESDNGMVNQLGLQYVRTMYRSGEYRRVYDCERTFDEVYQDFLKLNKEPRAKLLPCAVIDKEQLDMFFTGHVIALRDTSTELDKIEVLANKHGCRKINKWNEYDSWMIAFDVPGSDIRDAINVANRLYEKSDFGLIWAETYCSAAPDDGDCYYEYLDESGVRQKESSGVDGYMLTYDPDSYLQWNLFNSENPKYDGNVSEAWNHALGKDVKLGFIDFYVDYEHVDLKGKVDSLSIPPLTHNPPPAKFDIHETHCAGIALAKRNNDKAIAGVAPEASLLFVCVDSLNRPINYLVGNEAGVISISIKMEEKDVHKIDLQKALTQGRSGRGCIIVKSAGNNGQTNMANKITFPGNEPGVITVSSYNKDGRIDPYSSYGANIFVAAPGEEIYSTVPGDRVIADSGTSMAAPFVAGVVALMLEKNPYLHADSIRAIIGRTAIKIDSVSHPYVRTAGKPYGTWNQYYGYGAIDAAACLKATPRPGRYGMIIPSKKEEEI